MDPAKRSAKVSASTTTATTIPLQPPPPPPIAEESAIAASSEIAKPNIDRLEEAELDGAENMLPHNDDVKEDIVPMHSNQEGSDTISKNIHVPEDRSTMIIRHHSSILTSRGTLRADADNDIVAFVPQIRTSSLHTGPLSTLTA